jgi:hypothetical protein
LATVQKSPELLQAQAAAFAAERLVDANDRAALLAGIGNVAVLGGFPDMVTRELPESEYVQRRLPDSSTELIKVEPGTHTVATRSEFTEWLRTDGNARGRPVEVRRELITAYNQRFKEPVASLKNQVRNGEVSPLNSGGTSSGYVLHVPEGDFVVRLPRYFDLREGNANTANGNIEALDRVRGIPGVEQLTAISIEDGVTVSELLPGKDGSYLFGEDISSVTSEQLERLLSTLEVLHERDIRTDSKPSNFLYDPEKGFSVLDFSIEPEGGTDEYHQSMQQKVKDVAALLSVSGGVNEMAVMAKSAEEFAFLSKDRGDRLQVRQAFYVLCAERYPGEAELLASIKPDLVAEAEVVRNWSDPEWFTEKQRHDRIIADQIKKTVNSASDWI